MRYELFLGYNEEDRDFTWVEYDETLTIKGFTSAWPVFRSETADDNDYLCECSWMHSATINGIEYNSGDKLPVITSNLTEAQAQFLNDAYRTESLHSCSECGIYHDLDDCTMDPTYVMIDCEVKCRGCVEFDDLLSELNSAEELFAATDMRGIDPTEEYEEVGCLFCDSSGFGSEGERALTKSQAEDAANELIEKYPDDQLYCGLTDAGQFQVYVTIWRRK